MIQQGWIRLVRFGFRLLYNELAWTYDGVSWLVSLGEWSKWQRAALPFVNGRSLLEIGHGPGHLLKALAADGRRVVGLDLSPYMGGQARRRLHKAGVTADLVQGSVMALPLANAQLDTVLSTFPTNYILDPATLAGIWRVLRPNGRLLIVPEGHLVGSGGLNRLIDWLFKITGQRGDGFVADDAALWESDELWRPFREKLTAAGFTVQVHAIRFSRSQATVIVAEKREAPISGE